MSDTIVEIKIEQDPNPINPLTDFDWLGTFAEWHKRYNLGHKKLNVDDLEEWEEERAKEGIILPVYLYEHGGLALNTTGFSCLWDSGQVGYIYTSYSKIRAERCVKELDTKVLDEARESLVAEIKLLDQYLRGDMWCYTAYNEKGEWVDTVGGFYGSDPFTNGMTEYISSEYHHLLNGLPE